MKTYTLHTTLTKSTDNKWIDWNFHGCFEDAAREECAKLRSNGVTALAIRFDTYRVGRKFTTPIATRFERI